MDAQAGDLANNSARQPTREYITPHGMHHGTKRRLARLIQTFEKKKDAGTTTQPFALLTNVCRVWEITTKDAGHITSRNSTAPG
jgi:hypothetical protein